MTMLYDLRRQLRGAMLHTRRPLAGARAGHFRVRARGSGSDLDQLRDYQPGDDVRFIDWKSSARVQRVVVRDYRDERSRTVHLICDTSASMDFGMGRRRVRDCAADIAATLAILCENAGDACGLYLAGEMLSERLAPAVGAQQTARIFSTLTATENAVAPALAISLSSCCAALGTQQLRSSMLFVISDFTGELGEQLATYALPLAKHHVLVGVRVRDGSERYPERVGRQWLLRDSEQASNLRLETMSECLQVASCLATWRNEQERVLRAAGFNLIDCFTDGSIVGQICAGLRRCGLTRGRMG